MPKTSDSELAAARRSGAASPEHKAPLHDVQSGRDHRELPIDKVGVRGLRFPVTVRDKARSISTKARFSSTKASGTRVDRLTVVLDWTPNTNHSGVYLARAKGWYRDAGLDVKVIEPGDAGALQLLAGGKADVAFSTQEEIIPARAKGVPVVAIGAVVQHNTSSLLSLASGGIAGPADLPGHTYGGYGGPLETALRTEIHETHRQYRREVVLYRPQPPATRR